MHDYINEHRGVLSDEGDPFKDATSALLPLNATVNYGSTENRSDVYKLSFKKKTKSKKDLRIIRPDTKYT